MLSRHVTRMLKSWFRPRVRTIVKNPGRRLTLEELESRLAPALVWTGGGGALNPNWNNPANWQGGVIPTVGSAVDLDFANTATFFTSNNNIAGLTIGQMSFGSGSNYTLTQSAGAAITFASSSFLTLNTSAIANVSINMTFGGAGANSHLISLATGSSLTLNGQLTGSAGTLLTRQGAGTLTLTTSNANYLGSIKADNSGGAGVLAITNPNALGTGTVTIAPSMQLQLNIPAGGTINNPLVINGAGTGSFPGALLNVAGDNTWAGNVSLFTGGGTTNTTIGVVNAANTLTITGQISNSSTSPFTFNKEGPGTLFLNPLVAAGNLYTGVTNVNNGVLQVGHPYALGAGGSNPTDGNGTFVNSNALKSGTLTLNYASNPFILSNRVFPQVQTLTFDSTTAATTYNLGYNGAYTVVPVSYSTVPATNATRIANALNGLATIAGIGASVTVVPDATPGVYKVTFGGSLGGMEIPVINVAVASGPGTITPGTAVDNTTTIGFAIPDEFITLNGPGFAGATLDNLVGHNILQRKLTLNGAVNLSADTFTNLTAAGSIAGGSVTKIGLGRLILPTANTISNVVTISEGIVNVRDSNALGGATANPIVASGASLELQADAIPDSVGTAGLYNLYFPATSKFQLAGAGSNAEGALLNMSGVNVIDGQINLELGGTVSLGVAPDPDPYNVLLATHNNLSQLTINGVISNSGLGETLTKIGHGELVLTNQNTYVGAATGQNTYQTFIQQGWITVNNNFALGGTVANLPAVDQPGVQVFNGASLVIKQDPQGNNLNFAYNMSLSGKGINHRFSYLNKKGALLNLKGDNLATGNIYLTGDTGIGVERDDSGALSQLTLTGEIADGAIIPIAVNGNASGGPQQDNKLVDTGSLAGGTIVINANVRNRPDDIRVYLGDFVNSPGSAILVYDSTTNGLPQNPTNQNTATITINYTSTTATATAVMTGGGANWNLGPVITPYAALPNTFITIVVNEGGNLNPGPTVWSYNAFVTPVGVAGGKITKLGSERLVIQGPGRYTQGVDIQEGVVRIQNDTALGAGTSATPTTTTVQSGTALEFGSTNPLLTGGIQRGLQVWYTHLILNGTGNAKFGDSPLMVEAEDNAWRGPITLNSNLAITFKDVLGARALPTMVVDNTGLVGGTITVNTTTVGDPFYDAVQTLTFNGAITSGSFRLTVSDGVATTVQTAPITWSASIPTLIARIQTALNALAPSFGGTVATGIAVVATNSPILNIFPNARFIVTGSVGDGSSIVPADLTVAGGGELVLGGANTYRGTTSVNQGILTVSNSGALGGQSIAEVQQLTITVPNTTFTLTFNGQVTNPITYVNGVSGELAAITTELNNLSTIKNVGGIASVSQSGNVFTITLNGTLSGFNQTPLVSSNPNAVVTTQTEGDGGTIVADKAQLQLHGGLTVTGEPLMLQGQGSPLQSEVQRFSVSAPAAGTFRLTFKNSTTGDLAIGASAAEVQASLNQLADIIAGNGSGGGSVAVNLSGLGTYTVAFRGSFVGTDQPQIVASVAQQVVAVSGTTGTFKLYFTGDAVHETIALAPTATALDIENALNTLLTTTTAVPAGGIARVAQVSPGSFRVTFVGTLAGKVVPALVSTISTGIASVTVDAGGSSYSGATTVTFTGGGGSGATASATIAGGVITAINVVTPGSNFTSIPTVTITDGAGSGASATAILTTDDIITSVSPTGATSLGFTVVQGATANATPTQWFSAGPSYVSNAQVNLGAANPLQNIAGPVTGVTVNPADRNVIYISTAGGGSWKTTNGGITWTPLFDSLSTVQKLAIQGSDPITDTFTLVYTDPFTGAKSSTIALPYNATSDQLKAAIDQIVGTGNSVSVSQIINTNGINEQQELAFDTAASSLVTGNSPTTWQPNVTTFRLNFKSGPGSRTNWITYTGNSAVDAVNIQTELNNLNTIKGSSGTGFVTVTSTSQDIFVITFQGGLSAANQTEIGFDIGRTGGGGFGPQPNLFWEAPNPFVTTDNPPVPFPRINGAAAFHQNGGDGDGGFPNRVTGNLRELVKGSGPTVVDTIVFSGGRLGGMNVAPLTFTSTGATTIEQGVIGVSITAGGTGYPLGQTVSFTGGSGSGASGIASVSGGVTSISVTSGGSGYTSVPTVNITGGGPNASGASAGPVVMNFGVTNVTVTAPGTGYATGDAVNFIGGTGIPATGTVVDDGSGGVLSVTITFPGSYTSPPTGISFPTGDGLATGTITFSGTVVSVPILTPGTGYTSTPTINFTGGGLPPFGGAPAIAIGNVTGSITGVTITQSGSGYTSLPTPDFGAVGSGAAGVSILGIPVLQAGVNANIAMFGGAIAIDNTDPDVIYFGTGEGNGQFNNYYGTGVYRSPDGGKTWKLLEDPTLAQPNPLFGLVINKILVDSGRDVIYVATSDRGANGLQGAGIKNQPTVRNAGVWRYNLVTRTWFNLTNVVSDGRASGVSVQPIPALPWPVGYQLPVAPNTPGPDDFFYEDALNQNVVQFPQQNATWTDIALGANGVLYAALGNAGLATGVYHIDNPDNADDTANKPIWLRGQDRSATATGVEYDNRIGTFPFSNTFGNIKLAVIPNGHFNGTFFEDIVNVVITGSQDQFDRVTQSLDDGHTYASLPAPPTADPQFNNGDFASAIVATANTIYIGGHSSTGAGYIYMYNGAWTDLTPAGSNAPHTEIHSLTLTGGALVAGTEGGVWRYSGANWSNLNGNLANIAFNNIASDPTNPNRIFGTGRGIGTVLFNGNREWTQVDGANAQNLNGRDVVIDPNNVLVVYHSQDPTTWVAGGSVEISIDGGTTWNNAPVGGGQFLQNLYIDSRSRVFLGNGSGLFMANPFGSFNGLFPGSVLVTAFTVAELQGPYQADPGFTGITDLGASNPDPNTIYTTNGTTIQVTKDIGLTWVPRTIAGMPASATITDIKVDPSNRDTVYAVTGGRIGAAGVGQVWKSTDAGRNWVRIGSSASGLPAGLPIWKIVLDSRNNDLYVGTDNGVYQLRAGTSTWVKFGANLPNVAVHDLDLNVNTNILTIGTYGRSAYQFFLDTPTANSGALRVTGGTNTWNGPVLLAGPTTISVDGNRDVQASYGLTKLTINGGISDTTPNTSANTLTKIGDGNLILGGASIYGGHTYLNQGNIVVQHPNALGSPLQGTTVADGSILQLNSSLDSEPLFLYGNGTQDNGHWTGALQSLNNPNTYNGLITLMTNSTIGVELASSLAIVAPGGITDGTNTFTLTKEGKGTLILASANTYGGDTFINQGAVNVQNANALGDPNNTVVYDGAQIQLQGGISVTTENLHLTGSGIGGTGALLNVANNNAWGSATAGISLRANPAFAPQTTPSGVVSIGVANLADTLQINGAVGQQIASGVAKVGPGTLNFGQANSYSGTTYISAGTLAIQNDNALGTNKGQAIQRISTFNPGGADSFALSFNGSAPTANINFGANAATVAAALNGLSTIGAGGVTVTSSSTFSGMTEVQQLTLKGATALPAATLLAAPTTTAAGATLATGNYFYIVAAVTPSGETAVSNERRIAVTFGQRVNLSWSAVPTATSYRIYRSTTAGGYTSASLVANVVGGTTFQDTGAAAAAPPVQNVPTVTAAAGTLAPGNYYYVVTAIMPTTSSSETLASNEQMATVATLGDRVDLSWSSVPGATGYRVYRTTTPGTYSTTSRIANLGVTTNFNDTGVTPGTNGPPTSGTAPRLIGAPTGLTRAPAGGGAFAGGTAYYWTVVAVSANGESTAATEVTATPLLNQQVTLTWNSVAGATSYKVYRSTTSGSFAGSDLLTQVSPSGNSTASFIDTGDTPGANVPTLLAPIASPGGTFTAGTYYYVVTALTATSESVQSSQLSVITAANDQVAVSWNPVIGATGYRIYRSTTPGVFGASSLVASVAGGATVNYTDTGAATTAGTPPTQTKAAVQTLFNLAFRANSTATPVGFTGDPSVDASNIRTALTGLASVGGGNVTVTPDATGTVFTIRFAGNLQYGFQPLIAATVTQSSAEAVVKETVTGAGGLMVYYTVTFVSPNLAGPQPMIGITGSSAQMTAVVSKVADGGVSTLVSDGATLALDGDPGTLGASISAPGGAPVLNAPTVSGGGSFTAANAGTYHYVVAAVVGGNETLASNQENVTVAAGQQVALTWSPVAGATAYKVYRSSTSGVFGSTSLLFTTVAGVTSYTDSGASIPVQNAPVAAGIGGTLAAGTYFYVISATNANGETIASNETSVTVVANQNVNLSWSSVPGATGYKVFRGTSAGTYAASSLITTTAATSITDTGTALTAGTPIRSGKPLIFTLVLNGNGVGGVGALYNKTGNNTWNGQVVLQTNSSIGAAVGTRGTVDGIITDTQPAPVPPASIIPTNLTKVGTGTIVFSNHNTYTGNNYVNAGVLNIQDPYALGINTNTVQTVAVSGFSGTFRLQFNGFPALQTIALPPSLNYLDLQNALNTLLANAGAPGGGTGTATVTVQANGSTFNVTFGGSLAGKQVPLLQGVNLTGSTGVVVSQILAGAASGTYVANNASLQMQSAVSLSELSGKPLTLNGMGFNNTGALDSVAGNNLWAATPVILGSNASVAADGASHLRIASSITDNYQTQNLTFNGFAVGNTYNLGFGGFTTGTLTYTGVPATDAGVMQTALRNLLSVSLLQNTQVNVTHVSGTTFRVAFQGTMAGLTWGNVTATRITGTGSFTVAAATQATSAYSLTKVGTGTVEFYDSNAAPAPNAYTGLTTVNEGLLELNKTAPSSTNAAILGNLTVGDGIGGAANASVRLLTANQIANTSNALVKNDGLLELNFLAEAINALTIDAGIVTTGTGTSSAGVATAGGSLTTNSATLLNGAALNLVGDGSSVTVNGPLNITDSTITTSGANSVLNANGLTTMNGGLINLAAASSKMNVAGNISAQSNANGFAKITGLGQVDLGSTTRTVTVTHGASASVTTDLFVDAVITGNAGIVKNGGGRLELANANTYTGATQIDAGDVQVDELGKQTITLTGFNAGDTFKLTYSNGPAATTGQTADIIYSTTPATTATAIEAALDLLLDTLFGPGSLVSVVAGVAGQFNVTFTGAAANNVIPLQVAITAGTGSATAASTNTTGNVVLKGGTLSGTGTVGTITEFDASATGTVNPGANGGTGGYGILEANGPVTWTNNTTFFVNLQNTTGTHPNAVPGIDNDQLFVQGNVTLGNALLTGKVGTGIAIDDSLTIIQTTNGGTVSGKLDAILAGTRVTLDQGDTVFIDGTKFIIDYSDPTKVVLTRKKIVANVNLIASVPSPSYYGQQVIFTATVTPELGAPALPVGSTVKFTLDGNPLQTSTATVTTPGLMSFGPTFDPQTLFGLWTPGTSHTIDATFDDPAGDFATALGTQITQAVVKATVNIGLSASPSSPIYGQNVTITATVTPTFTPMSGAVLPSGTVSFSLNLGTPSPVSITIPPNQYQWMIPFSALSAGSHVVQAAYDNGDTYYAASSAFNLPLSVQKDNSVVAFVPPIGSSNFGEAATFNVTVSPALSGSTGVPTGTVFLYDGSTTNPPLDSKPYSGGTVSLSTNTLTVGNHPNIIVTFVASDGNYNNSQTSTAYTVNPAVTTVTFISGNPTMSNYGDTVTFTVLVDDLDASFPPLGIPGEPAGTVDFYYDSISPGTLLGNGAINGVGLASVTTPSTGLPTGTHTIIAVYGGLGNFAGSQGNLPGFVVSPAATTTSLVAIPSAGTGSILGQSVTLTATVTSGVPGIPANSHVQFWLGPVGTGTLLGTGLVSVVGSSGQASINTAALPVGTHVLNARFFDDNDAIVNFAESTGTIASYTVGTVGTATTVAASPTATARFGAPVDFTATITSTTSVPPNGSVAFWDGPVGTGTFLGTAPVVVGTTSSTATLTGVTTLTLGTHNINAVYSDTVGPVEFVGSQGTLSNYQITPALTSTSVNVTPSGAVFGQTINLVATVTSPTGTVPVGGQVTFFDGLTNLGTANIVDAGGGVRTATLPISTLSAASHTISAFYTDVPDDNFADSNGSFGPFTIGAADTEILTANITTSDSAPAAGTNVTITAKVTAKSPSNAPVTSGTVTFIDTTTGVTMGTGSVNPTTGIASVTYAFPGAGPFGNHTISIQYNGSSPSFNGSSATTFLQNVKRGATIRVSPTSTVAVNPIAAPNNKYGQTLSYNLTVVPTVTATTPTPPAATGTVTVHEIIAGTPTFIGTFPLVSSGALIPVTGLSAGSHQLTFTYSGDPNYATNVVSLTQQVVAANTTTTLDPTTSVAYGTSAVLTARVTSPTAAPPTTGTVSFYRAGSVLLGTVAVDGSGVATLNVTPATLLAVGSHTITAKYNPLAPTDNYLASATSAARTQVVTIATTQTVLDPLVASTISFGTPVTLSATVSITSGGTLTNPNAGTVTFRRKLGTTTVTIGTATVNASGVATFITSATAFPVSNPNSYEITATYNGSAPSFKASVASAPRSLLVEKADTTLTISAVPAGTQTYGKTVTFTATVQISVPPGSAPGTPLGTVSFYNGMGGPLLKGNVGLVTINTTSAKATFTTTATQLPAGTHTIYAVYSGNANFNGIDGDTSYAVDPASTSTTLTSSPTYWPAGQTTTFTATVAVTSGGAAGLPQGNVIFTVDGNPTSVPVAAATVNGVTSYRAVLPVTLPAGFHNVDAMFVPTSANFTGSSIPQVQTQNVRKATAVDFTTVSTTTGVNFTVTVTTPASGGPPTGVVRLYENGVLIGTVNLSAVNGTTSRGVLNNLDLSPGSHTITAVYEGDTNFNPAEKKKTISGKFNRLR